MRFVRFGEYVVDRELSVLKGASGEVAIEPKVFDLLNYLCCNPDRIVSRQDLLDHVWTGSIVTDNAINKIIANLRKLLADDPKNPTYIQTVPRKGYRLICDVEVFEAEAKPEPDVPSKARDKGNFQVIYLLGLIIILLIIALLFLFDDEKISPVKAQTLTRLPGAEFSGITDPSMEYLVFLKQDERTGRTQLWRKNLDGQQAYRVKSSPADIQQIFAIDEKDGALFYFQFENALCSVNKVTWNSDHSLTEPERLFECGEEWISDIVYHPTRQQIIYTSNQQFFSNSQIHFFNLKSGEKEIFIPPQLDGLNTYRLDLSPDQRRLLVLSMPSDYRSKVFTLDLDTRELVQDRKSVV